MVNERLCRAVQSSNDASRFPIDMAEIECNIGEVMEEHTRSVAT